MGERATGRQGISVRWDEQTTEKKERCLGKSGFIPLNDSCGSTNTHRENTHREKSRYLEEVEIKANRAGRRCAARVSAEGAVGWRCAGGGRAATLSSQKRGERRCSGSTYPPGFGPAWSPPPPSGSVARLHPTVHPAAKAPCLLQPGHPDPVAEKSGSRLHAGGSALLPAPVPEISHRANEPGSSSSYRQLELAGSF